MLSLISRLFGLFAFRTKKRLIIVLGIFMLSVCAIPTIVAPAVRFLSMGPRLSLMSRFNAVERSKLKEPLVRESYDNLLKDFVRKADAIAVSKPLAPAKILDYFRPANVWTFVAGALLWLLLGIIGIFDGGASGGAKVASFFHFLVIGLLFGFVAENVPMIYPFPVFVLAVLAVEIALLSVIGTMVAELGKRS